MYLYTYVHGRAPAVCADRRQRSVYLRLVGERGKLGSPPVNQDSREVEPGEVGTPRSEGPGGSRGGL